MEFINMLNGLHSISPGLINHLSGIVKTITLKRNEYLLNAGEVCKNIYFVKEGLIRWFVKREDGSEICNFFMQENDVVYAIVSFTKQTPSKDWIQALDACTLQYISYVDWERIFLSFPEFNINCSMLIEKYISLEETRILIACMPSPIERYQLLLEHHPEYIRRVPDEHIASYLEVPLLTLNQLKNN